MRYLHQEMEYGVPSLILQGLKSGEGRLFQVAARSSDFLVVLVSYDENPYAVHRAAGCTGLVGVKAWRVPVLTIRTGSRATATALPPRASPPRFASLPSRPLAQRRGRIRSPMPSGSLGRRLGRCRPVGLMGFLVKCWLRHPNLAVQRDRASL